MSGRITRSTPSAEKDKGKRKKEQGSSSRRTPPKQPKPHLRATLDFDSDTDDEDSHYDPAAKPLERQLGFSIPSRRMLRHIKAIQDRTIENTRLVCLNTLEILGVADDFVQLTGSLGFGIKFWNHSFETYRLPTLEFLSSLRLKYDEKERNNYMKFRLSNETHRIWFDELDIIFGFDADSVDDAPLYRNEWPNGKLDLWRLITGLEQPMRYKTRFIQHPSIRITQRVLAQTFYARGESSNQLNDDEGRLLDHMLRPNPIKPYLTMILGMHWLNVRDKGRTGGSVTMGAYVTLIARAKGIEINTTETCPGPRLMNVKWFSDVHFIKMVRVRGREVYKLQMEGRPDLTLPYGGVVDYRPETWLLPPYQAPAPPPPPVQEEEEPQQAAPQMPEPQGIPQDQPAWFTQFLNLSLSTRDDAREGRRLAAQNAEGIARLNERVDVIEHNQADWNFRFEHGYWEGNEPQPYYPEQDMDPYDTFTNPPHYSDDEPARTSRVHDFSSY